MASFLYIIAPFDIGHTYLDSALRSKFVDILNKAGWVRRDLGCLDLDQVFLQLNIAFSLMVHTSTREGCSEFGTQSPQESMVTIFNTGVGLVSCRYAVTGREPLSQYQDYSRNVFHSHFSKALSGLEVLFRKLDTEGSVLKRSSALGDSVPHWTHGILVSNGVDGMSHDSMTGFSQVPSVEEFPVSHGSLLMTSFGWETSAVTGSEKALGEVALLVLVLGYLWELYYIIDKELAERISNIDVRPAACARHLIQCGSTASYRLLLPR